MKTTIPDSLKTDIPQTAWGKVLGATPVILTVIATMLAGLASSEMTRAQYDRSLAAQRQSKAGDQWNFFQSKRLRSALQHNTLDVIGAASEVHPLNAATVRTAVGDLPAEHATALNFLTDGKLPATPATPEVDPALRAALQAVDAGRPEVEIDERVQAVSDSVLDAALRAAKAHALAFDEATKPANDAVGALEARLARANAPAALQRDFAAARLAYQARRYDAEAKLNQLIGSLYELQVRRSNLAAERHHRRSQKFFYGMLAAQLGVIVATFALAGRQKNFLWSLAATAGTAAVMFAAYVYWYV